MSSSIAHEMRRNREAAKSFEKAEWAAKLRDDIMQAIKADPRHLGYKYCGEQVNDDMSHTVFMQTEGGGNFSITFKWND